MQKWSFRQQLNFLKGFNEPIKAESNADSTRDQ